MVEEFLLLNGFRKMNRGYYDDFDSYCNDGDKDYCKIGIHKTYYSVESRAGSIYSDNLSIYWLIGILTYHGLMDKNYKTNKMENKQDNKYFVIGVKIISVIILIILIVNILCKLF